MDSTNATHVEQITAKHSLDSLAFIHVLHGYRVCYPILWDVSRDSFTDEEKVQGLQKALDELKGFDCELESSNGWSVDQKLWGIGLAIVVIEDILSSPDFPDAFRFAEEDAESWVEQARFLKPGMKVASYLSVMQDPLLQREALGSYFDFFQFNLPRIPEYLRESTRTSE
ncbi:uncharacterized protein FSUBG_12502 [Fusarium subglutinans]|uniref:Uncharacterized protein n=1 Tax=Gibberella subglutinans TaxID=42677 RepID=A0A8H5P0I3_GIBSU|nr:uncharacterized protein FSUBG_12502 [Fusarium subglutinans]KAF5585352.1 hypothetical protein FSUBG_12502 [Fusarium subglutinans]